MSEKALGGRSEAWIWWVCGLLLLASTINYMDRQTLSNTSVQITREFQLSDSQYGGLEMAFGLAFAVGASFFGFISDRVSVRWLYPLVLILWSVMGFATGLVESFWGLLFCRMFLGLFEAGHWPCALKTTQRLLPPGKRALGNSVLQSGAAIGAIVTPLIIKSMVDEKVYGSWRPAFQIVAAVGMSWAFLWVFTIRKQDLDGDLQTSTPPESGDDGPDSSMSGQHIATSVAEGISTPAPSFFSLLLTRRFLVLVILVVSINLCWHQYRVWMNKFLEQGRGYTRDQTLDISFWFNVMTDIGCLAAGFVTAFLHRRGWTVTGSRSAVFGVCTILVAIGGLIPWIGSGPGLFTVIMLVGLGALGLFPCYYSLSQELSVQHQGKITGLLGTIAWVFPALWHYGFGTWVDRTKSYDVGMAVVTIFPLVGWIALLCVWPRDVKTRD